MSPRALDWRSVQAKLRLMQSLLDQLRSIGPVDTARMTTDPVVGLAVERVLTQLVELAFGINGHVVVARLDRAPDSYRASFALAAEAELITPGLAASLTPSVGLRNVLVHNYTQVDRQVVADAVPLALDQYGEYVRQVASAMLESDAGG